MLLRFVLKANVLGKGLIARLGVSIRDSQSGQTIKLAQTDKINNGNKVKNGHLAQLMQ